MIVLDIFIIFFFVFEFISMKIQFLYLMILKNNILQNFKVRSTLLGL